MKHMKAGSIEGGVFKVPSLERPDLLVSYIRKGVMGIMWPPRRNENGYLLRPFRTNLSVLGKHVQELAYFTGIPVKIEGKSVEVPSGVFVNPLVFSNIKKIIETAEKIIAVIESDKDECAKGYL